ncbi:MSMEG_0567/Sll0786 family nitrogen starvation N-acetyltransferase [Pseudonocardia sp.]|uniref:MSMEG_0567/Sll0786 family nitrogen starvation N-acetyltransferase n=1 Tax=Pseudonocardia sp. TaxID=60912 RepID=UPI002638637B|nr:MSMEG_0567/Sll0786 family nitrogen starvation N-acetyltransferase [Pseudonocardia sp.]MCW2719166.1 GCN5-related N-acetyltransferase [Pseudonocardia sp.]MDT7616743.1 hypothetical protein [Pseudonocardiales bacterium]
MTEIDVTAPVVSCGIAADAVETAAHHAVRHVVFVREQRVFVDSDRDAHDVAGGTYKILGLCAGIPAGAVRLFPLDPADPHGEWQGDRLAVLPEFRSKRLGGPLTHFAVATAAAHGGRRMIAHVQVANRLFFRRMGWNELGAPELYLGLPHVLMDIDLTAVDVTVRPS